MGADGTTATVLARRKITLKSEAIETVPVHTPVRVFFTPPHTRLVDSGPNFGGIVRDFHFSLAWASCKQIPCWCPVWFLTLLCLDVTETFRPECVSTEGLCAYLLYIVEAARTSDARRSLPTFRALLLFFICVKTFLPFTSTWVRSSLLLLMLLPGRFFFPSSSAK